MSRSPTFAIGQRLELEVLENGLRFAVAVVKVVDRKVWFELASMPAWMTKGQVIRILFHEPDGTFFMDAPIQEVWSAEVAGAASLAIVATPMVLLQRRDFFRVPAVVPVAFSVTASTDPVLVGCHQIELSTSDLSGGGFRFDSDLPFAIGDQLELELGLPTGPLALTGKVVRISPFARGGRALAWIGVELVAVPERHRAELVRFIQDLERKRRPTQ